MICISICSPLAGVPVRLVVIDVIAWAKAVIENIVPFVLVIVIVGVALCVTVVTAGWACPIYSPVVPVILIVPLTSNVCPGVADPIPTFPAFNINVLTMAPLLFEVIAATEF